MFFMEDGIMKFSLISNILIFGNLELSVTPFPNNFSGINFGFLLGPPDEN